MKNSNVIVAMTLMLLASLLLWATGTFAQQSKPEQPAKAHQLSEADNKAIQEIMKDQETACGLRSGTVKIGHASIKYRVMTFVIAEEN